MGACGVLFGVLFRVTVQAHCCEIDVQGARGHQLQVPFWDAVWGALGGASDFVSARLTAGCCVRHSSGGAVGGAGVQLLLEVYAGVMDRMGSQQTRAQCPTPGVAGGHGDLGLPRGGQRCHQPELPEPDGSLDLTGVPGGGGGKGRGFRVT